MSEKRKKRRFDIFSFFEDDGLVDDNLKSAANSGYSISVTYGSDGQPVVKVQTQGNVNNAALRNELRKKYPKAKIEGLDKEPLIKEISTKKFKSEKAKKEA